MSGRNHKGMLGTNHWGKLNVTVLGMDCKVGLAMYKTHLKLMKILQKRSKTLIVYCGKIHLKIHV